MSAGMNEFMAFLQTDMGKLLTNITREHLIPYAKDKLFTAIKPVVMTPEEAAARASTEFATVNDFDETPK